MALFIGSSEVSAVYVGDTPAVKVYLGDTEVWSAGPSEVTFDAVGTGGSDATLESATVLEASWSHECSGSHRAVLACITYDDIDTSAQHTESRVVTYGGNAMTSLGRIGFNNSTLGTNLTHNFIEVFYLLDPPTGPQTVTATCTKSAGTAGFSTGSLLGNTVSYNGVGSVSSATTSFGSASTGMSNTISSAAGRRVVNVFGFKGGSAAGSYNQTARYEAANSTTNRIHIGDAPGSSSVSFTATKGSGQIWAAMAVDLILPT